MKLSSFIFFFSLILSHVSSSLSSSFGPFLSDPQPVSVDISGPVKGKISFYPAFFSPSVRSAYSAPLLFLNSGDDGSGCSALSHSTDNFGRSYSGAAVAVPFGTCDVGVKGAHLLGFGISMLVVYGCSPSPPTNCDPNFVPLYGLGISATLPVIYIRSFDGAVLTSYANSPTQLNISYVGTGPALPVEKQAIQTIVNSTTLNPALASLLLDLFGTYSTVWTSTSSILAPTFDPCLTWLGGIWCENGSIVWIMAPYVGWNGVPLPSAFGLLSRLRFIDIGFQAITAVDALCPISSLMYMGLENMALVSLPDCFSHMTNFSVLYAANNQITNFPMTLLNVAPSVTSIVLENNVVASFPSFSSFVSLRTLRISANQGAGVISSFNGLQYLITLDIHSNRFTGCIQSNFFDALPALTTIDLSFNSICGPLPNFVGASALKSIQLSHNLFSSVIPTSWSQLSALTSVIASNNQLLSPIDPLAKLLLLSYLDLSWNNLTANTSAPSTNGFVGFFIGYAGGPSLQKLYLDHNLLAGDWGDGQLTFLLPSLAVLSLSHNGITRVPTDIFDIVFSPPLLIYLDLSYNNIQNSFPLHQPPTSFAYLSFVGNPLFVGSLPSWAVQSSSSFSTTPGSPYICPTISSTFNPAMSLLLDPGFYNDQGCLCNNGFYGNPPLCLNIPTSVPVLSNLVPATSALQTFSDSAFGNRRYSSGMDTTWKIVPPVSSSGVVARQININMTLFPAFALETEQVTVMDSLSNRVASFQGGWTYILANAPVVYNVQVIDQQAMINFKSSDLAGEHFVFSYVVDYNCPPNYDVSPSINRCEPVFSVTVSYQVAVYIASAISAAVVVGVVITVAFYHDTLIIKSSSVPFCFLILFFLFCLAIGSSFWALQPTASNSAVCSLRPWFTGLSVVGVLATLLAKANRISQIFNQARFNQKAMTNFDLIRYVLGMLFAEIVLLVIYSSLSFSKSLRIEGTGFTANFLVDGCYSTVESTPYEIWLIVQFVYIGIFLLWGLQVAFGIRNVPSAFNESSHIVNCLVCLLSLGFIVVLIQFIISDNPNATLLLRGFGQSMVTLVLTGAIFGPKIYHILDGRANDKSLAQTGVAGSAKQRGQSNSGATGVSLQGQDEKGSNGSKSGPNSPTAASKEKDKDKDKDKSQDSRFAALTRQCLEITSNPNASSDAMLADILRILGEAQQQQQQRPSSPSAVSLGAASSSSSAAARSRTGKPRSPSSATLSRSAGPVQIAANYNSNNNNNINNAGSNQVVLLPTETPSSPLSPPSASSSTVHFIRSGESESFILNNGSGSGSGSNLLGSKSPGTGTIDEANEHEQGPASLTHTSNEGQLPASPSRNRI